MSNLRDVSASADGHCFQWEQQMLSVHLMTGDPASRSGGTGRQSNQQGCPLITLGLCCQDECTLLAVA
ncbi:hypothetical protein [Thermogemmatispora carboxidivorans]|uniref:hypothetical protein n=1 Tax=Thermogemmatispora carboxidivorans TaxID=1382306 RepID=UPI000699FD30|nr:hypothetical protein [Thermogemmatispora carboxidivorans]